MTATDRLFEQTQRAVHFRQIGVKRRLGGTTGDRAANQFEGPSVVALLMGHHAQQVDRHRMAGPSVENALVGLRRRVQPAAPVLLDGGIQFVVCHAGGASRRESCSNNPRRAATCCTTGGLVSIVDCEIVTLLAELAAPTVNALAAGAVLPPLA